MSLKVNAVGVDYAKQLIEARKVDRGSSWSAVQPSVEEEDQFLREHYWRAYGHWFLAVQDTHPKQAKQHYEFPYGDFQQVLKEGGHSCKEAGGPVWTFRNGTSMATQKLGLTG